eukprot:scaffold771_cov387-Prasinococcus_capsulatus_cf.AAC.14
MQCMSTSPSECAAQPRSCSRFTPPIMNGRPVVVVLIVTARRVCVFAELAKAARVAEGLRVTRRGALEVSDLADETLDGRPAAAAAGEKATLNVAIVLHTSVLDCAYVEGSATHM